MQIRTRLVTAACAAAALAFVVGVHIRAQQAGVTPADLPRWAYSVTPAPAAPSVPVPPASAASTDESPLEHVAGSKGAYTRKQLASLQVVPDWFPQDHPTMPDVVAKGRVPGVGACGHCHLPTGMGRPENQSVAGLPEAYMLQQIEDFRSGARKSSEPHMASVNNMISTSRAATPEEIKAGIGYFGSLKPHKWIRVVETDRVPLTKIASLMLVVTDANKTEPIGDRVIEVSEDIEQTELRNPKSGFVAYVPTGSLERGESLVKTGGNETTVACTTCHGTDLRGAGNIPSIAGRSPSQMARQLIDFQTGARNGAGAALMKGPVAKLTTRDIVEMTGYLASLEP
jgi:cytochrome c553